MNKIFKVVFNKVKGMFVVGSEHIKSHGRSKKLKASITALAAVALMGVVGNAVAATERLVVGADETETLAGETFQKLTNTDAEDDTMNNGRGGTVYNSGNLTISGLTFGGVDEETGESLGNTAIRGGAIYNNEGNLILFDTNTFKKNAATDGAGGAIYSIRGMVIINGNSVDGASSFINNTAASSGGAIYSQGGTLDITGAAFSDNTAVGRAGAIYAVIGADGSSASTTITNSTLTDNSAGEGNRGGAVYFFNHINYAPVEDSVAIISNSAFQNNSASTYGGAIYAKYADLTVIGSNFSDNRTSNNTPSYGGAISTVGTILAVENSTFRDNSTLSTRGYLSHQHRPYYCRQQLQWEYRGQ